MLTREKVIDVVQSLPETFTKEEILERIELLDKIEEGVNDLENGRVHSHEEIKNEFGKWLK